MSRPTSLKLLEALLGSLIVASMLAIAARPAAGQEIGPESSLPAETTVPTTAPPSTVDVSVEPIAGGGVVLDVVVPPEIAGTRLDVDAVGVIVDGSYVAAEVERLGGDEVVVVLAVDVSGSTGGGVLEQAVAAADAFVRGLPDGSRVGLVRFGAEATLMVPPTAELAQVRAALAELEPGGETSLFDGAALAANTAAAEVAAVRSVVVFSDGRDTASVEGPSAVVQAARDGGTTVDLVALESPDFDPQTLDDLAIDGQVWSVGQPEQLAAAFTAISDRLGNQFVITLDDVDADASIVIAVRGDDGVQRTPVDTGRTPVTTNRPAAIARTDPPIRLEPIEVTPVIATAPDALLGPRTLTYGLGTIGAGIFLAAAVVAWPSRRRPEKVDAASRIGRRRRPKIDREEIVGRLSSLADAGLAKAGATSKLAAKLEQSGSTLRPGEFMVMVGAAAMAAMVAGTLAAGPTIGVVAAVLVALGGKVRLDMKVRKLRSDFAEQLGSTLQLMASNLRVGHGLLQSVDAVGSESEAPTAGELRRVTGEVRLGRDIGESLRAMADRMDNDDFRWVVQAIEIHREVGGDLGEVLDNVGSTIRDRNRLKGQIEALSADGRISAAVMMALPFCVGALMMFTTPEYLGELTNRTAGQILLAFGALLMLSGGAWLKSIVKLEF